MSSDGVSLPRLCGLRALYLFVVVGLGAFVWPGLIDPGTHFEPSEGQAACMDEAAFAAWLRGIAQVR